VKGYNSSAGFQSNLSPVYTNMDLLLSIVTFVLISNGQMINSLLVFIVQRVIEVCTILLTFNTFTGIQIHGGRS